MWNAISLPGVELEYAVSISYDDIHYTTGTSPTIYVLVWGDRWIDDLDSGDS